MLAKGIPKGIIGCCCKVFYEWIAINFHRVSIVYGSPSPFKKFK